MTEMKQLYCDEHGPVMKVGETRTSWTTEPLPATFFCPICHREIFPADPLTEIERQGKPAVTFEEWKAREDMPLLDMGTIRPVKDDE